MLRYRGHSGILEPVFLTFVRHIHGIAAYLKNRKERVMNPWALFKRGFMTYWYWHVRQLNVLWPSITLDDKTLVVFPTVYKPLENEQSCVEYCREGDRVLDLGCGSGVCAAFAAGVAREVVAVDISPAALDNTKENCRRFGRENVTVMASDMFTNVNGKFDLILANPPYIAADFENDEEQFATSTRYLPVLFAQAHDFLEKDGRLLVQYPAWFGGLIKRLAHAHGLEVIKVQRMPRKSLYLSMLSFAYLQVGFRSTLFLIRPRPLPETVDAPPLVARQPVPVSEEAMPVMAD
jgi:release factor glutamine methyltransferase